MYERMQERLFLRLSAPFAACRPFVAGWYRPTAAFPTHSAIYGLLLNIAGIESRLLEDEAGHNMRIPASTTRDGLPIMRLALGLPEGASPPRVESIYQQLHNYPVGASGMPSELTKGTKNNITPVRRELLCDVRIVVAVECEAAFAVMLRAGLDGKPTGRQYGLPFLGDNSFLLDRLNEAPQSPVRWYERIDPASRARPGTTRLTLRVDRATMSQTKSDLFAPSQEASIEPTATAWAAIGD